MNYDFTSLCYVRFIAGVFAAVLMFFLWEHRNSRGAIYLILFEAAAAIWAIGDGFEAAALVIPLKLFWAKIDYIGISTSALMFFMFAVSYTNSTGKMKSRTIALLMIIPVLTVAIAFTNSIHSLLWTDVKIVEGTNQSVYYYGPWFWINVIYEYSLLTSGIVILIISTFRAFSIHRSQFWILIIGTILPFIASISYIFKLTPGINLDPTPISFILSGIVVAISLFRFRIFSIMPIARQQAINILSIGLVIVDNLNRIVDANPYFLEITDSQSDQFTGVEVNNIIARFNISIEQFTEDNDYTIEVSVTDMSIAKYFEVKCHNIYNLDKSPAGKILMVSDITTKKMILDTIADSNRRQKLEIIEKEKLIRDLDAYARSVAHDLKNPVSSVHGLAQLIIMSMAENDKSEVLKLAGFIKEQSEKMIRITDNLLMLSRIRKEDVILLPVEIKHTIEQVKLRLKSEIEVKNAVINTPASWPKVLGNAQLLEEVWINLISNALKYGGSPPVIDLYYKIENNRFYRFYVRDNGSGLPTDSLIKIFNDFERLGREEIEGHGLGLPIVRRIIEKMGGEVKAESTNVKGEGCIFSFTVRSE
jgi:signal transduction histidine kinase